MHSAPNVRHLLVLVLLWCLSSLAVAGKLYKIVNADGSITFSQFPPTEKTGKTLVNTLDSKGGAPKLAVTHSGTGSAYCGSISLPLYRMKQGDQTEIERRKARWEKQLRQAEERLEKQTQQHVDLTQHNMANNQHTQYLQQRNEYINDSQRDQVEYIKALRCAIHWAENGESDLDEKTLADSQEIKRLQSITEQLQARLEQECGQQPEYNPADPAYKAAAANWSSCGSSYLSDIHQVETRIRKLKRGY